MIAVDTNVLIRYLTGDDPDQYRAAHALLATCRPDRPGFVAREVLAEVMWTLAAAYQGPRAGLIAALEGLLGLPLLRIEDADRVGACLAAMKKGTGDFADLMILAAARDAGCDTLYTFDRKLARQDGATLLETA